MPSIAGSASRLGSCSTVQSGSNPLQLGGRRADEHVAGEQAVPGLLGDHAHLQPVRRVGAGIEVLREQLAAVRHAPAPGGAGRRSARASSGWLAAPQSISSCELGVRDEELVLGRAAGEAAGGRDQRAVGAEAGLLAAQRFGDQRAAPADCAVHRGPAACRPRAPTQAEAAAFDHVSRRYFPRVTSVKFSGNRREPAELS